MTLRHRLRRRVPAPARVIPNSSVCQGRNALAITALVLVLTVLSVSQSGAGTEDFSATFSDSRQVGATGPVTVTTSLHLVQTGGQLRATLTYLSGVPPEQTYELIGFLKGKDLHLQGTRGATHVRIDGAVNGAIFKGTFTRWTGTDKKEQRHLMLRKALNSDACCSS